MGMATLFGDMSVSGQSGFAFPQQLTEKYRPMRFEDFAGLEKPKKICKALANNPRDQHGCSWDPPVQARPQWPLRWRN